jgi:hypothetical protein
MSLKNILLTTLLGTALALSLAALSRLEAGAQSLSAGEPASPQYTAWVGRSLKQMQSVKVGMTRADLLKVFTTEGGLSTGLRRTYVYRECPYFKVDVECKPVDRPARDAAGRVTLVESGDDLIKSISKPYLGWSISD